MSIVTRTGDDGTTGMMYGRRVPKSHPRIAACGAIDELNAALGLARAVSQREGLLSIQKELVGLMGELATLEGDMPRYIKDAYPVISEEDVARLDHLAATLESGMPPIKDWAMPGANPAAAAFDFARTVCRRAERQTCSLEIRNPQILIYLNRLSDVLWLMARASETPTPPHSHPAAD